MSRVCVYTASDKPFYISHAAAKEMVSKGEAWIIRPNPLTLREARSLAYKDEVVRRRGRVIPGVHKPNPSRLLGDYTVCVFDHKPINGAAQGRCFPPRPVVPILEIFFQLYKRELAARESEKNRKKAEVDRINAERRSRIAPPRIPRVHQTNWKALQRLERAS